MEVTIDPLTLCKLEAQQLSTSEAFCGCVTISLSINVELKWTLHYLQHQLKAANCPLLSSLPDTISSVAELMKMIETLDAAKYCVGNPDQEFVEYWQHRKQHYMEFPVSNLIQYKTTIESK